MLEKKSSIELVNPEISRIKVGAGIGLILISFILLISSYLFSEYIESIKIILKFGAYLLSGFGGVLIGFGLGGGKYRSQWIKKRD
ncbi:MAG: hypothetical protein ACFFB5_12440 [Promethearchaeota archaeon]